MSRRPVFSFFVLVWLLAVLAPFPRAGFASTPATFGAMPPHPSLLEKIARGEVVLPQFMTDPEVARSMSIDYSPTGPRALTGTIKALAVLVEFSDKAHTVTASFFDTLIFAAPVAGRGSVRDYYREVSYDQVDIVTVNAPSSLGWKTAPSTYAYYTNNNYCTGNTYPQNCQKLAEDIVDAVNSVVNFADYDNDHDGFAEPIMLIHAGPGAEFTGSTGDIWSHSAGLHTNRNYDGVTINKYVIMPEYWQTKSASTSDITIGVFAHEMGHGFWGLPDLYDRTPSGSASSYGIGNWSLMAAGSWNGPNSGGWGTDGSSPAWPDAWSRVMMGFVAPTNISSNVTGKSIPQTYSNPSPAQTVLKMRSAVMGSQEYFLLENRQQVSGSYDEYMPGNGLFIWHVDEAMNVYTKQNDYECDLEPHYLCNDNYHYLVALEQADDQRHLERKQNRGDANDPFPAAGTNRNWTMTTHPENSSWYTSVNTCIGVTNISNSGATMTADPQVSGCAASTFYIYLPLSLKNYSGASPGPTAGFWKSTNNAHEFYVTSDGAYVKNHAVYINVAGCGSYKITHTTQEPISNNQYSFSGPFYASGTFNSSTTATVTDGLGGFVISGCGVVNGGPWTWPYNWQNSSQPMPAHVVGPEIVEPVPATSGFYEVTPLR